MSEEKRVPFSEFYEAWRADPSKVLLEDAVDHLLFYLNGEHKMSIAHGRRFDLVDDRLNKLEERIAALTTEIARWREEIRLMRDRMDQRG